MKVYSEFDDAQFNSCTWLQECQTSGWWILFWKNLIAQEKSHSGAYNEAGGFLLNDPKVKPTKGQATLEYADLTISYYVQVT